MEERVAEEVGFLNKKILQFKGKPFDILVSCNVFFYFKSRPILKLPLQNAKEVSKLYQCLFQMRSDM